MVELDKAQIEDFLQQSMGKGVRVTGLGEIGSLDAQGMKDFGYGKPLLVHYDKDGQQLQAVLSVMRGDKYGHQFYWDRAAVLMFQHETCRRLDKHVHSLGLGYLDGAGRLRPAHDPQEFVILNEKLEGKDYFLDLERIRKGDFRPEDETMARDFARWLADAHSRKLADPDLYHRRIRDLIGHSECIFGLVDGYPHPYEHFPPERFQTLEKRLVDWRWKLKSYTHRLCAVHGDFHPWNVLVRPDGEFAVLDRSRGEWGDAADDVSTMSCNYLLFGLYDQPSLGGHFEKLYLTFWEEYLGRTNDREILEVIAPFYVFRTLVVASPEWYPNHPLDVRKGLFRFMENVLADDVFAYDKINSYMR
jgi:hypothetical protein